MQVHMSGNYIPIVISPLNYTSLPSMVEILLFDLVFHDGVTPVSVSILKLWVSPIVETLSISYSRNSYIRLVVIL